MPKRVIPSVEGYAGPDQGAKLFAPAAARNAEALGDVLERLVPTRGRALELASGTGQHAVAFARRLPGLEWQPSEIDAARRASVDAYVAEAGLANIAPAVALDATAPGWGAALGGHALVLLSNLLHLVSREEAETLIGEAAQALVPGGLFVVYGPFLRGGVPTSEGDARFHASILAQDPDAGYKDAEAVLEMMAEAGLERIEVVEMPANNLCLVARRLAGQA